MATRQNYNPSRGPITPQKYPKAVGPAYYKYGEQPGWVYNPWNDTYVPDPKAQQQYLEETGQAPKSNSGPSTLGQIGIAGGGVLAAEVAREAGKDAAYPFLKDTVWPGIKSGAQATYDAGKGLFGVGDKVTAATTTPGATTPVPSSPTNAGLLGQGPPPASAAPVGDVGSSLASGVDPMAVSTEVPANTFQSQAPQQGFNYGKAGQGLLGAAQAYQGVQQWKEGDKVGGGINTAAGAANVATAAGADLGSYLVPGLNALAGAKGAYDTAKYTGSAAAGGKRNRNAAMSGAMAGAAIGSVIPGVGTLVGAAIGALIGGTGSGLFGSSKGEGQMERDITRAALTQNGLADLKQNVTLADGTTYHIGRDGKAKLQNMGQNIDGKTERHPYDVDWSNPLAKEAASILDPQVREMLGEGASQRMVEQTVGMLTNAATSNAQDSAGVQANIKAILANRKSPEEVAQAEQAATQTLQESKKMKTMPEKGNMGLFGVK